MKNGAFHVQIAAVRSQINASFIRFAPRRGREQQCKERKAGKNQGSWRRGARPSRSLPSASRRWLRRAGYRTIWCDVYALDLAGETPTRAGGTPALPKRTAALH